MVSVAVRFPTLPDDVAQLVGHPPLVLCEGGAGQQLAALDLRASVAPASEASADKRLDLGTRALSTATFDANGRPIDEEVVWSLPIGIRLHALALLCQQLAPREPSWLARCPREVCDKAFELELPLAAIIESAVAAGPPGIIEIEVDGTTHRVRPPTAADLRRWIGKHAGRLHVLADLMESAGSPAELPAEHIATVEAALAQRDPLVDFRISTPCPECGDDVEIEVELESVLIDILGRAQTDLLSEVDRLALHYHWSEGDILAMPAWRRRRYLSLLDREAPWAT